MRRLMIGLAALAAAEAAIACVCVGPLGPEEQRSAARRIAQEALAVADVELVEPLDHDSMRAELYRVRKVHVGKAPAEFRLDRDFTRGPGGEVQMTMTSCDVIPPAGQRTTVVLYPGKAGALRIGSTCDHLFVNMPGAVRMIQEEAAKRAAAERG